MVTYTLTMSHEQMLMLYEHCKDIADTNPLIYDLATILAPFASCPKHECSFASASGPTHPLKIQRKET